jgi:integrase
MEFGSAFKKPSARALRKHKRETGKKLYSANEVLRLIHECGTHIRAMTYLGINCGFGPTDCAKLPLSAVNLKTGWIDFPRPKTEVDRLCPLWPETVAALEASLDIRLLDLPLPAPPTRDDSLSPNFFLHRGRPWNTTDQTQLSKYFTSVRKRILKDGGWYWLRHTFETVGGGAKDQIAVNAIMGHADHSMAAVYREEISPERLRAVTDYVREWLFAAS